MKFYPCVCFFSKKKEGAERKNIRECMGWIFFFNFIIQVFMKFYFLIFDGQ